VSTPARRAAIALALALAIALGLPAAAPAKKGKKNANVFSHQQTVNLAIPDHAAGMNPPPSVPLVSTIQVPKRFKGKVVKDLNVTGIQTTGGPGNAAGDLTAYLTAPNGHTIVLLSGIGAASIGPLTIDDDTTVSICNSTPATPCSDPLQSLYQPFAGTANTIYNAFGGFPTSSPLAGFNGLKLKGTWTLTVVDNVSPRTSVLNHWGLRIVGKPG
jgi:subtilisin-like proprotein convertase family protein